MRRSSHRTPPAPRAEAVLFAGGLLVVSMGSIAGPIDGQWAIPGSRRTPMVFLLPFLLWAAVRFGPGGTSMSLLTTTVIVIVAGMSRRGPFFDLEPVESVLALQIFLIAIGIPLLTLAAVIDERKRAEEALGEQLSFERLFSRLSAAFVHLPSHRVDQTFETWLGTIGEFLDIDTFAGLQLSADGQRLVTQRSWISSRSEFEEDVMPAQAAARVVEVFATALARRDAEDALRASEVMKSEILNSLTDSVAVLNREGRVIVVNESWSRFARALDAHPQAVGVGVSYLGVFGRALEQGAAACAADVLTGIEAVLNGSRARFGFECMFRSNPESWWVISVEPLSRPGGGAVVSHTEITERKRAEIDAQRSREDLAHFTRTSTMGELTASLAHELNQPLTGIMTNAQTAQRLVQALLAANVSCARRWPRSLRTPGAPASSFIASGNWCAKAIRRSCRSISTP